MKRKHDRDEIDEDYNGTPIDAYEDDPEEEEAWEREHEEAEEVRRAFLQEEAELDEAIRRHQEDDLH